MPFAAIVHREVGDHSVYVIRKGVGRLVPVKVSGRSSGYNCISSSELQAGDRVVVFTDTAELNNFYNGIAVTVSRVLPLPERILHKRIDIAAGSSAPKPGNPGKASGEEGGFVK